MVYFLNKCLKASELAMALELELLGPEAYIQSVGPLSDAGTGCLTFSLQSERAKISGPITIGPQDASPSDEETVLLSLRPRRDFVRALLFLEGHGYLVKSEAPAMIHPTADIGVGVVIGSGCEVGEGTVIEPNVVIMNQTKIGSFSRIRANSTIGSDGFGFERADDGSALRFIHLGGVRIGSDVEIGANTCIARGTFGDTVIEDGVKIDNLVHIAHNVTVGAGAFVIAGAEISGGCRIGERAWIGPNACLREKVQVGDEALVGIGATVLRSIPPGEVHVGNPARPLPKSEAKA